MQIKSLRAIGWSSDFHAPLLPLAKALQATKLAGLGNATLPPHTPCARQWTKQQASRAALAGAIPSGASAGCDRCCAASRGLRLAPVPLAACSTAWLDSAVAARLLSAAPAVAMLGVSLRTCQGHAPTNCAPFRQRLAVAFRDEFEPVCDALAAPLVVLQPRQPDWKGTWNAPMARCVMRAIRFTGGINPGGKQAGTQGLSTLLQPLSTPRWHGIGNAHAVLSTTRAGSLVCLTGTEPGQGMAGPYRFRYDGRRNFS